MPLAWFLVPYESNNLTDGIFIIRHRRRPVTSRYLPEIVADGGAVQTSEGLGNHAVARVRASQATLDLIAAHAGVIRVPQRWLRLVDNFTDMTNGERNQIENKLLSVGFTQAEIDAALGSTLAEWRAHTLHDLLNLVCSGRIESRRQGSNIIFDGPVRPCRPVAELERLVNE